MSFFFRTKTIPKIKKRVPPTQLKFSPFFALSMAAGVPGDLCETSPGGRFYSSFTRENGLLVYLEEGCEPALAPRRWAYCGVGQIHLELNLTKFDREGKSNNNVIRVASSPPTYQDQVLTDLAYTRYPRL